MSGYREVRIAIWSPVDQRLPSASADAWRSLRVRCWDADGKWLGQWPYELFYANGDLPVAPQ